MRDKRRKSTIPGSEPPAPEASEPLAASSIARLKAISQAEYELGKTRQAAVLGFLVEAVAYPSVLMRLMTPFMGWLRWVLLVMLILPTPVHAADFWTESFEPNGVVFDGVQGYSVGDNCFRNSNWQRPNFDNIFNPNIATTSVNGAVGPFSGSQMCHGHYTVQEGTGNPAGS